METRWEPQTHGSDGDRFGPTARPGKQLRILIVDNHRDSAVSLCFLCRLWGHDAQCCFDARAALNVLDSFKPEAFVLDIAMPRMSGYGLAEELRQHPLFHDSLLIAVSGFADEAHRLQAAQCGFDHFLPKPADPAELKHLLRVHQLCLRDPHEAIASAN